GIEVGHVFKLGAKYSNALKAVYLYRDGTEKTIIMGCYGIGIGRTVAACIEQNFDQNGIIWPMPLAPSAVIVTPVNINEPDVMKAAGEIYEELLAADVEVILDDRDERAGVKFKDADLIGIPLRIVVGSKNLARGQVELKIRKTGENRLYAKSDIAFEVRTIIAAELKTAG
ncbi:MAG: His/Gly/Thr/Pro-type tRNA ligase C-terminal domain-containing protein, partial [Smithella sp.]